MPPVDRLKPTRAKSSESLCSLMEFMREFPDDNACLEWLWRNRHLADGETAHCPKCDQDRTFKRYKTAQRRQSWTCTACGHHVHPTAGTIFQKSSTSLHLWFYASDRRRRATYGWNAQTDYWNRKAVVFGAVERSGRIKATVVPNSRASTILPLAREYVLPGSM